MRKQSAKKSPKSVWEAVQPRLWSAAAREVLSPVSMGVAHDLNNLLSGVCSISDLCLREAGPEHPFRERLELMRTYGERAAKLVQTLFREHQASPGRSEYHDLNTLTEHGCELARRAIPKSIEIQRVLAAQALPVSADAIAFRTVLLNLMLNAADAIEGKGSIHVRTARHSRMPATRVFRGVKPSPPVVSVQISDTGHGVDKSFQQRLWDPLFTTKAASHGAGLGLYLAEAFCRANHGGISVDSAADGGAAFTLWLPEADLSKDDTRPAAARHVLLGPGSDAQTRALVRELRRRKWKLTTVPRLDETLLAAVPVFDLLIAPASPSVPSALRLIAAIRRQRLPIKIVGLSRRAISEPSTRSPFDLVIYKPTGARSAADRIEALFAQA